MSEQTNRLLNDIRTYLRIYAAGTSKGHAPNVIDTYEKALVFSMLDGKTSQAKLEQTTKIPDSTISRWLEAFVGARLASPPDDFYQSHRALFTLAELGIELQILKKRATKSAKSAAETTAAAPTPQTSSTSDTPQGTMQKYLEGEKSEPTKQ